MRVRSLVWEDPVCCGVAGSLRHSCWAWVLEPASCNYWAQSTGAIKASVPGACAPQQGRPQGWEPPALRRRVVPLSPQLEKTRAQQWRHGAVRNKIEKKKKRNYLFLSWRPASWNPHSCIAKGNSTHPDSTHICGIFHFPLFEVTVFLPTNPLRVGTSSLFWFLR